MRPRSPSRRPAAVLALTLLLCACEVTDDPRRGGLVSGIWALSSGAYDERLEERERQLEDERRSNEELERNLAGLQGEEARVAAEKEEFDAILARLDRKLRDLQVDLRALERSEASDEANLGDLEAELRDLERRRREAGLASDEDERRESGELLSIEQELLALEKTLNSAVASSVGVEE